MATRLYFYVMTVFTKHQWWGASIGFVLFIGATVTGALLYAAIAPLPWLTGLLLAVVAIFGLVLFVGVVVHALLREGNEGVEAQAAARASIVTVLVTIVGGVAYSLLEAFVGVPRVTAAMMAAIAGFVWVLSYTSLRRGMGE